MNRKLVFCFLVVTSLCALFVINAQKKTKDEEPDVNQFPILDYRTKTLKSNNKKDRKKYNNTHAPRIGESSDAIFSMSDWEVNLPALPTAMSAAVIVGEVTQAQAQLSEDETNIYSEFTLQIENILKNDDNFPLVISNPVVVERLGGRVRLPSGKVLVSQTDKQDLPRVGKRYVLFLTRDINDGYEDFHILTGYELRDGKVFPLDKLRPTHPIMAYKGTTETSFFADLNKGLANPTSQIR